MSIEVWQFPQSVTKAELASFLQELGYVIGQNPFLPGPSGTVDLFWSEPEDFKSTSGVDASVFPVDDAGKEAWKTSTDWALRTRTSIWATSFDQEFQNHTVRSVRKRFGGRFYNDQYGHCRYNVVHRTNSTPSSRGVYGVLTRLVSELDQVEYALPEEMTSSLRTPRGMITSENDTNGVLPIIKRNDPARVVYNALVPFLVASIEHFFRECFEILLKYDRDALTKVEAQNRKISLTEALAIARGELTIERVVSNWYSFQNVDILHKAYSEILGIDILRPLRVRKKVRGKLPVMRRFLHALIEARHGVVHHFDLDRNLDRNGLLDLLHSTRTLLVLAAKEIENKLRVPIGPG